MPSINDERANSTLMTWHTWRAVTIADTASERSVLKDGCRRFLNKTRHLKDIRVQVDLKE